MSVIVLGDPHIGRSLSLGRVALGSAFNSRIIDQSNLLDWTLEQAILNGAETIICTGDVFEDPKPHPSFIILFIAWLKQCEANGIFVYVILGNHDILRTGNFYVSPLDIISECELSNVSIIKELCTVYLGETAFTLMPFRDRKSFNVESNAEALALLRGQLAYEQISIPMHYRKVLIGHLALEGSIPIGDEIDDLTNELFCPLNMFHGYDCVFMGHIHKPQILQIAPEIAHIGSMDISNFGETDHQKHIILYDPNEEEKIRRINLPTRPLHKIVISVPKETEDSTQFVIDEITKNFSTLSKAIVRLEVHLMSHDLLPTNRSELEKFLYSQKVFNVSAISESKKLVPIKKDGETKGINSTVDVSSAIKLWAETQLMLESQKKFIEVSFDILQDFKTK